jgi:hypothetical protein
MDSNLHPIFQQALQPFVAPMPAPKPAPSPMNWPFPLKPLDKPKKDVPPPLNSYDDFEEAML